MVLCHVSRSGKTIYKFDAFTHFGTNKAAFERSKSAVFSDAEPTFYEVEFTSSNPLRIKDLSSAIRSNNHGLVTLVDHLHYEEKVLSSQERSAVFVAAGECARDKKAGLLALSKTIKLRGFDSIVYRNRFEDSGSNSYISLDDAQVSILRVLGPHEMVAVSSNEPGLRLRHGF